MNLYELPIEILLNILNALSAQDLLSISETCQYMRELSKDEHLWKCLLDSTYNIKVKLFCELNWHCNFVVACNEFKLSSSQKNMFSSIKMLCPKVIETMKNIKQFDEYTLVPEIRLTGERDEPKIMSLDDVVITYWMYKNSTNKSDSFVGIIDTTRMGKSTLHIKNGVLYASGHRGYPFDQQLLRNLRTTGTLVQQNNEYTEYTLYLTKPRLCSIVSC